MIHSRLVCYLVDGSRTPVRGIRWRDSSGHKTRPQQIARNGIEYEVLVDE